MRLPLELIERLRALRPTPETPKDHLGFVATAAGAYFLIVAVIEVWRFLTADILLPLWRLVRPWLWLLAVVLPVSVAEAQTGNEEAVCTLSTTLYCDNFEDRTVGYTAATTWPSKYKSGPFGHSVVGGTPNLSVTTTRAFTGTKSMQLTTPTGQPSGGFMDADFQAGGNYPTIYYRAYEYWASDYYFSVEATKNWHLRDTNGTTNAYMHFPGGSNQMDQFSYTGSPLSLTQNAGGAAIGIVGGQWYCLELRVTRSTGASANGIVEGWIDGVQKWNYPAVVHQADTSFYGILIVTYWNCTDPNPCPTRDLVRWIDNIVIATQPIGCIGSPPGPHGFILRSSLPLLLGLGAVVAYALRHQGVVT